MTAAEIGAGTDPVRAEASRAARDATVARIDALVRELVPDLLGYFLNRLDEREDASDAVADTLLVLWRKSRSIPGDREEARRYAFGIARHVLRTHHRGRQRRNALADRLRATTREATEASPVVDLELRDALARLPHKDREIVQLVAWDGFSVADAGRIVGCSPEAARARYSRARSRLREILVPGQDA